MHLKPLIGLTCSQRWSEDKNSNQLTLLPSYVRAVEIAGGVPVIVPVNLGLDALGALFRRLDGILLPGGADVSASAYGVERVPSMYGEDPVRDAAEIALCRWAVRDDKPILAICRGIQVLNVALGGALYRHIADEFPTTLEHDHEYATQRASPIHEVSVETDSLLHAALGVERATVNSLHHQAVSRLGEGLRAVAHAPDGLTEGVEHPARRFALGVQWHPEELVDTVPAMRRLFWAFVQSAGGRDGWRHGALADETFEQGADRIRQ